MKAMERLQTWTKIWRSGQKYVRAQYFFKRSAMGPSNSRPSESWVECTVSKNYPTSAADPDLVAEVKALQMVSLQTLSPKTLADAQALRKQVKSHKFIN